MDQALTLILTFAPGSLNWIRRNVKRILLSESGGATFISTMQTCRVGVAYARRASVVELAMTVVHEATHARLERAGAIYEGNCMGRIERACVASEVRFASKVPGSEAAIARVEQLLETQWWNDGPRREAARRELERFGLPEWLRSWIHKRGSNDG